MFRKGQHDDDHDADELDVIGIEHDRVIRGAEMGAVQPARGYSEPKAVPLLRGQLKIANRDHYVVKA